MATKIYNYTMPGAGDPLDLTMLSQMATYIAEINAKLLAERTAFSSLQSTTRLKVSTDDVTIWTGKILVATGVKPVSDIKNLSTYNWNATFDISFTSVPVVTVTPFLSTSGQSAANSCWIKSITSTGVSGSFKFVESPKRTEDVYVLITAIGGGVV